MLRRRVIVCLDVRDGSVVKGVRFNELRPVGDPAQLAAAYERDGADEIVLLDVTASVEDRQPLFETVRRTADRLSIPLTVGGGVRSVTEADELLRAGADKISVNSAAVMRPSLLRELAARFGAQCVVASIDARVHGDGWRVYTHGGRNFAALDAVEWADRCAELGAGELLVTSIDRDGGRSGYDLNLTRAIALRVAVPVIASGGAGSASDVAAAFEHGGADAALIAGMVHDGSTTVAAVKAHVAARGIAVREACQ